MIDVRDWAETPTAAIAAAIAKVGFMILRGGNGCVIRCWIIIGGLYQFLRMSVRKISDDNSNELDADR